MTAPSRVRRLAGRLWLVPVAVVTLTGADVIRFPTDAGTLVVEVNDPAVKVALDGQELRITGAGPDEVRLKSGPHLFLADPDKPARDDVLTLSKGDKVVVRVRAAVGGAREPRDARPRDELVAEARRLAGDLVGQREDIDVRLWATYKGRWTHAEAAKLLIRFHRGQGQLPDAVATPAVADALRADLTRLRDDRARLFDLLSAAAAGDAAKPASGLVGTWRVAEVTGAGGLAADALDLFDPDPVGRRLVVANGAAALLTGGGLWYQDVTYPDEPPGAVDFEPVVRGGTVIRGRFRVDKDEATLRLGTFNAPRPSTAGGDPTDGGVVLRLRRTNGN